MIPKVDIVVERQWHAPALACALMKEDRLGHVFTGFPKSRYRSQGVPAEHLRSNPLPAVWNLGVSKFKLPSALRKDEPAALASFVSRHPTLSPVVTCLATSYQHLFPKLLDRPIVRVIECGSMHPEENFHLQQRGRREAGLSVLSSIPTRVAEECEAAKLAHLLVCGSQMIVDSYLSRGYDPERVLHCPYGTDPNRFTYFQRKAPKKRALRMATVGVIGIRKGIGRLISISEWAQRAGFDLEIHLIGPVDTEVEPLIAHSHARFVRHGVLKGQALVDALHQVDLYCLPSYEEGFGISIIEAMATGLPAVVSDQTGGKEALTHGVNGLILADFNEDEFEENLKPWLLNPDAILTAGKAAADTAAGRYALDAYAERVNPCYLLAIELSDRMLRGEQVATAFPDADPS